MALGLPRGWCWTRRREIRRLADRLCRALAAALGVDGAAMSALTHTPLRQRLGSSDELADLIETVQFSVGEGPCVQAAATGNPVIVEDLHAQAGARWPGFAELAARRLAAVGAVSGSRWLSTAPPSDRLASSRRAAGRHVQRPATAGSWPGPLDRASDSEDEGVAHTQVSGDEGVVGEGSGR